MSFVGRKLFWWIFVPLTLVILFVLSIPFILRSVDYKALLIWQLESQLHRKVELGRAEVELFPHVRIALEGIKVLERDGLTPFLSADRLFVDLRVFPLLARKVIVKRVILDRPTVVITRGVDGVLNVADLFTVSQGSGLTVPILGEEIKITDGQITFTNAYQTDSARTLIVQHLETSLQSGVRAINIWLSARIPYDNTEAKFLLTATVPRPTQGGALAERGEGRLDARGVNLNQLAPFMQTQPLLEAVRGLVDVKTAFEYRAGKDEDSLTLKDLNVSAKGTVISGSAIIKGILTKPAGFLASLKTTTFHLESLIESVPEEVMRAHGLGFLTTNHVGGTVRLASLRVVGNPDQQQPVTVQGDVELYGGHAVIGEKQVPLSDVNGFLRVDADHVAIERLTGKYGQAEVSSGRGEIRHLTEDPQLYLAARGKVSAQELAVTIARFAPRSVLPEGVKSLSGLTGEADASVVLDGALSRLDDLRVDWTLEPQGIGFVDPRLRHPVTGLHGKVSSMRRGVLFEELSGLIGKSTLALGGQINYPKDEPVVYDFKLSGRSEAAELWSMLTGSAPVNFTLQGTTEYKVTLAGPADQLRAVGNLDITHTGIVTSGTGTKPQGVPGDVDFTMHLADVGRRLRVDRLFLEIPPFTLIARGNVGLDETHHFKVSLRVPAVAFRAFPEGLLGSNVIPTAGNVHAELVAEGVLDDWWNAGIRGRASIKNLSFKMERVEHQIEDLNLEVAFHDNRIDLEKASVRIEDSQINATGTIRGWRGVPMVDVSLDSPGMDLDLLIPKGERSPIRTALEAITKGTKLSGTATIHDGTYKGIEFDEIRARLAGGDSKLIIDSIEGTLPVGLVKGQLTLTLLPDKPIALESTVSLERVPVEPFMQAFGIKESPVTGSLNLKATLRGESGTYSTLNGEVSVVNHKGYFQKFSATSKIIGILNLPTLLAGKVDFSRRGMPFDCLSAVGTIKNGLMKIDRYVVDSPIMKITAAGEYDIPSNNTNMVMAITPLGSYEEFLKGLPVFGKLFIGDGREVVTAFYEVKGPLDDPKVRLMPIKSVTSGVGALALLPLEIMKNVFLLPKELLSPSKAPPSPCAAM